jgi:hypothetical protein
MRNNIKTFQFNGMEWNGMEWNGMEWNGIKSVSSYTHILVILT